ncbi:hypothetical protein HID58_089739, partial [Brassica napus]
KAAMAAMMQRTNNFQWGDIGEDDDLDFLLPPREVIGPDENGVKKVIEYRLNEEEKIIKVTTTTRVEKRLLSQRAAERRKLRISTWNDFNLKSSGRSNDIRRFNVSGGICRMRGDHWTARCPQRDLLSLMETPLTTEASTSTEAYVPPSRRTGASDMRSRRNDENSLRVTNLSEDTREQDLMELFHPFGAVTRAYVAFDKNTNVSRGFGFVNFMHSEERAISTLNGYGYDNLILRVEWATPRPIFVSISVACFFLGKHWSEDGFRRLVFFSSEPSRSPIVALSPDLGKSYNISDLIHKSLPIPPVLPPPLTPPPPPSTVDLQVFGIVDENGTMSDEFRIGDYDAESLGNQTESESGDGEAELTTARASVGRIEVCPEVMTDYIPCLDNVEAIKRLESTARGERFERHCPKEGTGLNCTVPAPNGGQNWILEENDKFKFPGGGTQFIHGADQYLDQISQMVPDVSFGNHTRVVLDIGCGVASFGAYLMSRDVLTLSIAPKDVHENQIQFALERGVPAMVAAFTTRRLLYPSQAFDLVHCSRCRINWTRDDGILLLEVNRMLRAGGYFVWAAQPVYKHEKALEEQWEEMLNLTTRLCWVLVKKEGYIAIWQKPTNNTCYLSRDAGIIPPLCNPEDDPDNLKACITRIEDNGYGANLAPWPSRLQTPPDRLQTIQIDSYIARKELFVAEYKYWKEIISNYVNALHWKQIGLRNVMDMRAGYGGFAAALAELKVDCWVLNVVPVSGANTLPVIYDRGLLGVMHDWCEPFDTYPRTYDLLHAAGLFSIERKRCNMTTIMLEMDRILRPGGRVYIRDTINVMSELQEIGNAMRWHTTLRETAEGPHASYRVLLCEKKFEKTVESSVDKHHTKKKKRKIPMRGLGFIGVIEESSVSDNDLSGDVRGSGKAEESNQRSNFLWFSNSTKWGPIGPALAYTRPATEETNTMLPTPDAFRRG